MEELGRFCATFRGNLTEESCPDILVLNICKRERHRSIATKQLMFDYFDRNKEKYRIRLEYGPSPNFPRHFC
eukprot:3377419-Karenia_brevis.AAC.1